MPNATIRNLTDTNWAVPIVNRVIEPLGSTTVYLEDVDGFLGDIRVTNDIDAGRISVTVAADEPGAGGAEAAFTQYMHLITAGEVAAGFITLPSVPGSPDGVAAWPVSGVIQVNKQAVGATGATPDFDIGVDGAATMSISNNGAATGLSGLLIAGTVLTVIY